MRGTMMMTTIHDYHDDIEQVYCHDIIVIKFLCNQQRSGEVAWSIYRRGKVNKVHSGLHRV